MIRRISGLALALALLTACTAGEAQPTPTLIVMGLSLPTTTPEDTRVAPPTPTSIVLYTTTPTIEPPPTHTPSATPTATATPRGTQVVSKTSCLGVFGTDNLLVNGGFEGGQHVQEVDSFKVPDGWIAFWRPDGEKVLYDDDNKVGYQRPEMMVISKQPPYVNPPRIDEGNQALTITGNQRAFDAGIYQVVGVTPGDILCLTGSAQAWSNRLIDDPFSSTLATVDDEQNANLQLGIDVQGGSDPFSPNIEWSEVVHPYNIYKKMNAVAVTATGPTVTVFVRGFMLWRFDHNELFLDGILLSRGTLYTPTPPTGIPQFDTETPTP